MKRWFFWISCYFCSQLVCMKFTVKLKIKMKIWLKVRNSFLAKLWCSLWWSVYRWIDFLIYFTVEFKETSVVLTCPHNGQLKWTMEDKTVDGNSTYEIQAQDGTVTGFYTCQNNNKKHHFFIKARGEDTLCEITLTWMMMLNTQCSLLFLCVSV